MENAVQEITSMIGKLSIANGDVAEYECLAAMLINLNSNSLKQVLQNCDIMKLFMAMDLHEKKYMEVALRLASTLFAVLPLTELIDRHLSEVIQALQSDKDELVEFVLTKLKDGVCQSEFSIDFLPVELFQNIISLLVHENLAVYKASSKFFLALVHKDSSATSKLFGPENLQHFNKLCTNSSNKLRVAELLVSLVLKTPKTLSLLESAGLFHLIPEGLLDKDPLTNLNFIQLAKGLTVLPEGYAWLENQGLLDQLSTRLSEIHKDSFGNLLLPGYLAFFGCVARQRPFVWISTDATTRPSSLLRSLKNAIESSDTNISLASMETVAHIATVADGRRLLHAHLTPTGHLKVLLPKLGRLVRNAETFVLLRALECTAELMKQPSNVSDLPESVELARITMEWAAQIGSPEETNTVSSSGSSKLLLKRLMSLVTNPFPDMRLAALKALCSLSTQPWGVHLLLDQPGCMEYLLNRNTEVGLPDASQLMQSKYDIVNTILATVELYKSCETPEFLIHLRPEQLACLRLYVKEGVWGAKGAQATIAMQSG